MIEERKRRWGGWGATLGEREREDDEEKERIMFFFFSEIRIFQLVYIAKSSLKHKSKFESQYYIIV